MEPSLLASSPTILVGNIRGLNPSMSYSKIDFLRDLAIDKNSIAIAITESHLNDKIYDHEINIKGWAHSRSDRVNRNGGGVIVYVKDNLTMSDENAFSNSMCESVAIYQPLSDLVNITTIRPPSCVAEKFEESITAISN